MKKIRHLLYTELFHLRGLGPGPVAHGIVGYGCSGVWTGGGAGRRRTNGKESKHMALNIKDPEADRLARELAARTGETITETVVTALRERLKRETGKTPVGLKSEIMAISRRAGRLPRRTGGTPEAVIGYDGRGLPR